MPRKRRQGGQRIQSKLVTAKPRPILTDMRAAVLIIGSLFWRKGSRETWRGDRLDVAGKQYVRVPIRYRRRSQKQTYTMAFACRGFGVAVAVPCQHFVGDFAGLLEEARELWKAEDANAGETGTISKNWGAVGILFRRGLKQSDIAKAWTEHCKKHLVEPTGRTFISDEGALEMSWPKTTAGKPVDFDLLLATGNVVHSPTVSAVAKAWLEHGEEEYFFNNVATGIQTPLDAAIWRRLSGKRWPEKYRAAIGVLRKQKVPQH